MELLTCQECSGPIPTGRRRVYCSSKCSNTATDRRYRLKNPKSAVEKTMRWRKANPEYVKAYDRKFYAGQRATVLEYYGGVCACCAEATPEFLTVDHINNDGAEHRRQGVTTIYRWLVSNNFPTGFQLLCWNCNAAKQFSAGCPHQLTEKKLSVDRVGILVAAGGQDN